MNSRFSNNTNDTFAEDQWSERKPSPRFKHNPYHAVQENPALREYKGLLDHFNMSVSAPFDDILLDIMRKLKIKSRISLDQTIWLSQPANQGLYNSSLRNAYHASEAFWDLDEFNESNDPLKVISAAGHLIKAKQTDQAIKVLSGNMVIANNRDPKVVASYYLELAKTQYELRLFNEAKTSADLAYASNNEEVKTILLLGGLSLHLNNVDDALKWYAEARKFYKDTHNDDVQSDIKNVMKNIPVASRQVIVKALFAHDAEQFKFLRGVLPKKMKNA